MHSRQGLLKHTHTHRRHDVAGQPADRPCHAGSEPARDLFSHTYLIIGAGANTVRESSSRGTGGV